MVSFIANLVTRSFLTDLAREVYSSTCMSDTPWARGEEIDPPCDKKYSVLLGERDGFQP